MAKDLLEEVSAETLQLLVKFGDYLLQKNEVKKYNDKGQEISVKHVTDPDLRNFFQSQQK